MIVTIDREKLDELLVNDNQNKINRVMYDFAAKIPPISSIEELYYIDKLFYSYFSLNKDTPKFSCTSEEIFDRRTYSGCSDIGLAIAPILRLKGIPTIYIESGHINWIKELNREIMILVCKVTSS